MHERTLDHIFIAETPGPHEAPRVDSTAGDEGIDDPDVSGIDSPGTTTDITPTSDSNE